MKLFFSYFCPLWCLILEYPTLHCKISFDFTLPKITFKPTDQESLMQVWKYASDVAQEILSFRYFSQKKGYSITSKAMDQAKCLCTLKLEMKKDKNKVMDGDIGKCSFAIKFLNNNNDERHFDFIGTHFISCFVNLEIALTHKQCQCL